MNTADLRTVTTVARLGNFTAAAQELFLAQSTVSRQVCRVERELGTLLFVRLPDGVRLSAAGRSFVPVAAGILADLDHAQAALRA